MEQERLHKEIDLIQSCITRMANNSFLLKGWTVSLVAVVLALVSDNVNPNIIALLLILPVICFWYLDAFFLQTERKYRKLYSWVIENRKNGINDYQYDLNPNRFNKDVESVWMVMFSVTLRVFYLIPLIIILSFLAYNSRILS